MRARPTLNSIRLARTIRRSNGGCAAPSVFLRRNRYTIRSLGCASFAMNVDEPYKTGSTPLRHLLLPDGGYKDEAQCDSNLSPSPLLKHYPAPDCTRPQMTEQTGAGCHRGGAPVHAALSSPPLLLAQRVHVSC